MPKKKASGKVTDDSIKNALTKVIIGVVHGAKLDAIDCQSIIKHITNLEGYQQMVQQATNTYERRN